MVVDQVVLGSGNHLSGTQVGYRGGGGAQSGMLKFGPGGGGAGGQGPDVGEHHTRELLVVE